MAKAKLPPTIDAISGHIAGLDFWLAAGTQYVTGRPPRPGTRTPRQKAAASAWTNMLKAWTTSVDKATKANWTTFGAAHPGNKRCGGTAPLSAFQAFSRTNARLRKIGRPITLTPPAGFTATDPASCTASYSAGPPQALTVSAATRPGRTDVPVIRASGPKFPGVTNTAQKVLVIYTGAAGARPPWDVTQFWIQRFGLMLTGQLIKLELEYYDQTSGAKSPTRSTTIVIS